MRADDTHFLQLIHDPCRPGIAQLQLPLQGGGGCLSQLHHHVNGTVDQFIVPLCRVAAVVLKADPKKEDRALVQLQYEGKKIIVSIEGYRVMRTVAAAISPEGFSGENVVVEGA